MPGMKQAFSTQQEPRKGYRFGGSIQDYLTE